MEDYKSMIDNFDKSLFKGKDLGLLNRVLYRLNDCGFDCRLEGSAKDNALKGRPRNYADIDIKVKGGHGNNDQRDFINELAESYLGFKLEKLNQRGNSFFNNLVKNRKSGSFYGEVIDFDSGVGSYVNSDILFRFKIKDKKTNTVVDLCFE